MEIIKSVEKMQERADNLRSAGGTIGLVPTMGYLHEGHLSLMDAAKKRCDTVIVSIFVNPTQFGPGEDFDSYPRDLERDTALCRERGVDIIFAPEASDLYGGNFQTAVTLSRLPRNLCGISRPTHFDGVALVVTKLFNITKPHAAVFGNKDFQQVAVIRQLTADLNFDIEIIGAPIVREKDGLAMSSRNTYLDPALRPAALSLNKALAEAAERVKNGERDGEKLIKEVRDRISAHGAADIDYIALHDPKTLEPVERIQGPTLMALAVKFGKPRLLDNIILSP